MLDLRVPIGTLFVMIGLLLAAYGLAHSADPAMHPTGIPIVTIWGAVQVVAGLAFLAGARHALRRGK